MSKIYCFHCRLQNDDSEDELWTPKEIENPMKKLKSDFTEKDFEDSLTAELLAANDEVSSRIKRRETTATVLTLLLQTDALTKLDSLTKESQESTGRNLTTI